MERDLEETLFIIITKVLFHICFSNRGITSASLFFSLQSKKMEGGMSEMCQLEALSEASAIVSVMDYHAGKSFFPVAFIKLTKQVRFLSLNLRCLLLWWIQIVLSLVVTWNMVIFFTFNLKSGWSQQESSLFSMGISFWSVAFKEDNRKHTAVPRSYCIYSMNDQSIPLVSKENRHLAGRFCIHLSKRDGISPNMWKYSTG